MELLELPDCMLEQVLKFVSYDEMARARIVGFRFIFFFSLLMLLLFCLCIWMHCVNEVNSILNVNRMG